MKGAAESTAHWHTTANWHTTTRPPTIRPMNRREFLQTSSAAALAAALPRFGRAAESSKAPGAARITHVSVQVAPGRRLTPVAPNAYAPYRGFDVKEPVLRIRSSDGLEGVGRQAAKPEVLKQLVGLDLFSLFE